MQITLPAQHVQTLRRTNAFSRARAPRTACDPSGVRVLVICPLERRALALSRARRQANHLAARPKPLHLCCVCSILFAGARFRLANLCACAVCRHSALTSRSCMRRAQRLVLLVLSLYRSRACCLCSSFGPWQRRAGSSYHSYYLVASRRLGAVELAGRTSAVASVGGSCRLFLLHRFLVSLLSLMGRQRGEDSIMAQHTRRTWELGKRTICA
jgi:hypothetical protein